MIKTSQRLVNSVELNTFRYLYHHINWHDRLVMIKGARGVGKTTMLLQRIKSEFGLSGAALYASCDNLWFTGNSLVKLATDHYDNGGTHLFLDEIHRYAGNWQQELKNIYDSLPGYHVVFTGSSMIHLDSAIADLSRRCLPYELWGLSFREYLLFQGIANLPAVALEEILDENHNAEWQIINNLPRKVLMLFREYLSKSYYPFYKESSRGDYYGRIQRLIDTSITRDIPMVENIEVETLHKLGRLLYIMSTDVPFTLNVQSLSQKIQVSRNSIIRMFSLLEKGGIIRCIHSGWKSPKSVAKPQKILFNNVDIMGALSPSNDIGTVRETFVASMLSQAHSISEPPAGDFLVDEKYVLEIGGRTKTFKQIADVTDSFAVVDDTETGIGRKLPMWVFGFLY